MNLPDLCVWAWVVHRQRPVAACVGGVPLAPFCLAGRIWRATVCLHGHDVSVRQLHVTQNVIVFHRLQAAAERLAHKAWEAQGGESGR